MKKISKVLLSAVMAAAALVSCTPEQLSTDQLSVDEVKFAGFAPNPVARGGALRLYGSNLQKVEQVIIPGVEPITEIEVIAEGKVSEVRVIVPVDGPEVGVIQLVAGDKTFTSTTELTYSEPIIFDDFTPKSAVSGTVLTVTGDYMNNIKAVQFPGGAVVSDFEEQSRYELKVAVPSSAVSGKIILSDVDENNNPDGKVANLFYSEAELTVGDPTVNAKARGELKAGAQVQVSGEHLDMIQGTSFAGVEAQFTVAEDGKSLVAVLPDTAADGTLVLTSYAGKQFEAGEFTTTVPTELAVAADSRYKAGLGAKVSGKDLDLVSAASLSGTALEYSYADNVISFTIPAKATDGTIVLSLANGKTVATEAIELVKPTITAISPAELYAGEGNVSVSGTDLDLVVSATLGGKSIAIAEGASETALELVTDLTSVSGKVALTLENGVIVESADAVTVLYHSLVVVTEMTAAQHIGEEVILKGSNFDLVENIFVGDEKVTRYTMRTAEEVHFIMPWLRAGSYNLSFHLFNGDVETVATPIEVQLERMITTIWEGNEHISWSGMTALSWGGYDFSNLKAGTVLTAYFDLDADQEYWQMRFGNGSWASIPSGVEIASSLGQGDGNIPLTAGTNCFSITLTAADIEMFQTQGGLVMTGTNYTLTKLTLTTEISQEITIFEGPCDMTWGDDGRFGLATEYFENLQPGAKMIFYIEHTHEWGQVQINDGWWKDNAYNFAEIGGSYIKTDIIGTATKVELTLDAANLEIAKTHTGDYAGTVAGTPYESPSGRYSFVLQGQDIRITKITIL